MEFKNDIKVRTEDSKIILTYNYKDILGVERSYGKSIEICKDMPMGIIEEFLEQCVVEIAIWQVLAPGIRHSNILDTTKKKEDI